MRGLGAIRLIDDGEAFSPLLLSPRLFLLSDVGITAISGKVSNWADQSGNGFDAGQASPSHRPAYVATDSNFGDAPSLTFDGATSFLSSIVTASQPNTIIVVADGTNVTQAQLIDAQASTARQAIYDDTAHIIPFAGSGLSTFIGNIHAPSVLAAVFNGAASALYKNNSQTAVSSGDTGTNNMGDMCIGGFHGASNFWAGSYAAVMVFPGAMSAADRKRIFTWAGNRYGISVS